MEEAPAADNSNNNINYNNNNNSDNNINEEDGRVHSTAARQHVYTAIHRTGIYKDGVCSSVGGFFQKLNCNAKAEDMPPREPWIRSSWWWPLLMACACCLLLAFCAYGVCPVWENKEQKRAVGTVSTAGP